MDFGFKKNLVPGLVACSNFCSVPLPSSTCYCPQVSTDCFKTDCFIYFFYFPLQFLYLELITVKPAGFLHLAVCSCFLWFSICGATAFRVKVSKEIKERLQPLVKSFRDQEEKDKHFFISTKMKFLIHLTISFQKDCRNQNFSKFSMI